MKWFISTLARAVVAGIGWKLGSDAYEVAKKRIKEYRERKHGSVASAAEDNGGGATETDSVDVGEGVHPVVRGG